MADPQPDTLNVITTALAGERGPDQWQRRRVEKDVLVSALISGLDRFVAQMRAMAVQALDKGRTLQGADQQQPDNADKQEELLLDELVFHAEVSPEGEFKLLGSGVEMGEGGVKFVWRRKHVFGTAGLSKALLSSIVEKGRLPNKLVAALVGSQQEGQPFNQANTLRALAALVGGPQSEDSLKQGAINTNQHVQVEIMNIVYTAIVDVVNVLLAGV